MAFNRWRFANAYFLNAVFFTLGFFILVLPASANGVYYCAAQESAGFEPRKNYEFSKYQPRRFNVQIDFEKQTMVSEKIYLKGNVKCITDVYGKSLYCVSEYGRTLAVNKVTLGFHTSTLFLNDGDMDDITISYGSCEKF